MAFDPTAFGTASQRPATAVARSRTTVARWTKPIILVLACFFALGKTDRLWAGGGPQNVVLIVDPGQAESAYLANVYRAARHIPARNVLYMKPGAVNYQAFASYNLDALLGTLANRGLTEHIDYVVVAPGPTFYVETRNLVTDDACPAPITRLAISSAYSFAFMRHEILAANLKYNDRHRYFGTTDDPIAFDSQTRWYGGLPSDDSRARRFFIGFLLGYIGQQGNTPEELARMIERSVQADGSRPEGTFYLMRTSDRIRSQPRDFHFARIVESVQRLGGKAQVIEGDLPLGQHDVMAVITGKASLDIDNADMTLLPGAYADHLTSFAATFDVGGQTKLSRWIAKGASGSAGTVEEPCAAGAGNTGKFPHPRLVVWYLQGLSLGEALFRSAAWTPFQTLYYGDPLTQPYARFPAVTLLDVPDGAVRAPVVLTPLVLAATPGAGIRSVDLYVDGRRYQRAKMGKSFVLDPLLLGDGYHELEVVATEDTPVATQGRWRGGLRVAALGRETRLEVDPPEGDLDTLFECRIVAGGSPVRELRLLQNWRVLAAQQASEAMFRLPGRLLGAGPVELVAIAEYEDGRLAFSPPVRLAVRYQGRPLAAPRPAVPLAYSYSADVLPGTTALLDLPSSDENGDPLTATIDVAPQQATVESDGASFLLRVPEGAQGQDELVFRATDGQAISMPGRVSIRYCSPPEIRLQPTSVDACPGGSARFEVAVNGGPMAFQWFKDDEPLPAANGPTLVIPRVTDQAAGMYRVQVTRLCGLVWNSVSSAAAALRLASGPACLSRIYLPQALRDVALNRSR